MTSGSEDPQYLYSPPDRLALSLTTASGRAGSPLATSSIQHNILVGSDGPGGANAHYPGLDALKAISPHLELSTLVLYPLRPLRLTDIGGIVFGSPRDPHVEQGCQQKTIRLDHVQHHGWKRCPLVPSSCGEAVTDGVRFPE